MGKLNCDPHIQHFSHEHPLELCNYQPQQLQSKSKSPTCAGCRKTPSSGLMYTCKTCYYILDIPCSQMPKLINHPSHPSHPLILLPTPAYPEGLFNCDACGRQKNKGFSYHCTVCSVDIHVQCGSKPISINHQSHLHPLTLCFKPPYETNGFSCDICNKLGSNHWLYRCGQCGFDAHIGCATATNNNQSRFYQQPQQQLQPILQQPQQIQYIQQQQVQPQPMQYVQQQQVQPLPIQYVQQQQMQPQPIQFVQQQQLQPQQMQFLQQPQLQPQQMQFVQQPQLQPIQQQPQQILPHQSSYPGANRQSHFMSQGVLNQGVPMVNNLPQQQQQQRLYHVNSAPSTGFVQMASPQVYDQQQVQNNNVTNAIVQGFIDGAAQQLGQDFAQSIMGGNNGDSSSTLSLDLGSSSDVLGSIG